MNTKKTEKKIELTPYFNKMKSFQEHHVRDEHIHDERENQTEKKRNIMLSAVVAKKQYSFVRLA